MEARVLVIETVLHKQGDSLDKLTEDTSEIVEFVRNGKLGVQVAGRSVAWLGRTITIFAKVGIAVATIFAAITAVRQGKLPDVHLFP